MTVHLYSDAAGAQRTHSLHRKSAKAHARTSSVDTRCVDDMHNCMALCSKRRAATDKAYYVRGKVELNELVQDRGMAIVFALEFVVGIDESSVRRDDTAV